MKKTLISGIILTILGAVLLGLGILHHGDHNLIWHDGGFKIEDASIKHATFKEVHNLKINADDDVQIKPYAGSQIKVTYRGTNTLDYQATNHQLSINDNSRNGFTFNLGLGNFAPSTITIYVPSTSKLNKLICNTSGTVSITDLNFNQIHLSSNEDVDLHKVNVKDELQVSGYSDLELRQVSAASLAYDSSDGDVTINDSKFIKGSSKILTSDGDLELNDSDFKQLKLVSDDGDLNLNRLSISESLTGRTSDGDIHTTLKDSRNLAINADSDDGHAKIFGKNTNYYHQGSQKTHYSFTSSDGNIIVR